LQTSTKALRWFGTVLLTIAAVAYCTQLGNRSPSAAPIARTDSPAPSADPPTLASWNITRLGHGQNKDYSRLGEIAQLGSFDFLAVQEVMTEDGLERLHESIATASEARWEKMSSHAIGRGSHREMYAFLWNAELIEYVDTAVVYLDTSDDFIREPYSARFRVRASGLTFVAATVHINFGKTATDRKKEILALTDYWRWLQEIYAEDAGRILLMGDFNWEPHKPEWDALRAVATPLIVRGKTTLSTVEGRFANLYDNIWVPLSQDLPIAECGILEFPAPIGLNHEEARVRVSDHAPVWVRLESTPGTHTGCQR
jgi:endonuclease/exonuclease/phosphatase family metal-dependent hydrolase